MKNKIKILLILLTLFINVKAVDCTGVTAWVAGCHGDGPTVVRTEGGHKWTIVSWWVCTQPSAGGSGWTDAGACSSEPVLTSVAADNITRSAGRLKGNISSDNGFGITDRGFIYYTTELNVTNATIGLPGSCTLVSEGGITTGDFNSTISSLPRNTTYYYKSYATNSQGTSYGLVLSFTTLNGGMIFTSNGSSNAWTTQTAWTPNGTPNLNGAAPVDTVIINHTINYTGNLDIKGGCKLETGASGILNLTGNLAGGLSAPNGTILNAGTMNVSGSYSTSGDYTVFTNTGTFSAASISLTGSDSYTNSGNITTTGAFTHNGTGTINSTAGTLTVGTTLTLGADAARLNFSNTNIVIGTNFDILGSAGATLGGTSITIGGSFTNTGAAVTTINNNITIGGNLNNSAGSTFTLGGNVTVTGNVNQTGNSPITVNGQLGITGGLTLTGSGDMTGTGTVGWGGVFSASSANAIRCGGGDRFDTNGWNDPAEPLPPFNPLNLQTCSQGALPIELISFTHNKGCYTWVTASEINNDYFVLEGSNDAINWSNMDYISGAGNSTVLLTYTTCVNSEFEYVRLKQVDYDGKYSFSNILFIVSKGKKIEIERFNILGQPVDYNYTGLVIIRYNNNTYMKVYK